MKEIGGTEETLEDLMIKYGAKDEQDLTTRIEMDLNKILSRMRALYDHVGKRIFVEQPKE